MKKNYLYGAIAVVFCVCIFALTMSWCSRWHKIDSMRGMVLQNSTINDRIDSLKTENQSLKHIVDSVRHQEFLRENGLTDDRVHDTIEVYKPRDMRLDDIEKSLDDIYNTVDEINSTLGDLKYGYEKD